MPLRRYFDALCLNSAGVVEDKTHFDVGGITRATAGAYERLLMDLQVVEQLPAWRNSRFLAPDT